MNDFVVVKKSEGQILVTLYHMFVTFIILSVFVALITSKFMTNYSRMVAEASLLRASVVLQLEKNLSKADKLKLMRYYKKLCNPLVCFFKFFFINPSAGIFTVIRGQSVTQGCMGRDPPMYPLWGPGL